MQLPKYSIGVGDRFAHQGCARLEDIDLNSPGNAAFRSRRCGTSRTANTRLSAAKPGERPAGQRPMRRFRPSPWGRPVLTWTPTTSGLKTVDGFLDASDFFTIDVAEQIGSPRRQTMPWPRFIAHAQEETWSARLGNRRHEPNQLAITQGTARRTNGIPCGRRRRRAKFIATSRPPKVKSQWPRRSHG